MSEGIVAPAGELGLRKFSDGEEVPLRVMRAPLAWRLRNYPHLWRGLWKIKLARILGIPHFYGTLSLKKITPDGVIDYGIVGYKVVTNNGCGYIVDAFQNSVELENMKYHGFGTGGTAEAASQSALVTEFTTEYAVNSTRPTGTTTELSAQVYETVATFAPDSGGTLAVTEHGVFSASSAGVLLDRTLFSAVNLVAGTDTLQSTYDLTFASGS